MRTNKKRELNEFEQRRIKNEKQPGETSAEIFTTALSGIDRRLHVPVHCGPWLPLDTEAGWRKRWSYSERERRSVLMNWCCQVTCPNWPGLNGFSDPLQLGSWRLCSGYECTNINPLPKFLFLHKRTYRDCSAPFRRLHKQNSRDVSEGMPGSHAHTHACWRCSVLPAGLISARTDGAHDPEPWRLKVGCYSTGELSQNSTLRVSVSLKSEWEWESDVTLMPLYKWLYQEVISWTTGFVLVFWN